MTAPVDAEDDVQTGAMIALVPTPADLARLALEGGEPVEQLHCTVLFLGEAVDFEPAERQSILDWAKLMAANWEAVLAEAFAPALFNPAGDQPCAVLVLSGEELAEFYETTSADVTDLIALPEQHLPYIPHVTLAYFTQIVDGHVIMGQGANSADIADLIDRCGPISFDTLRVAFADEITDIPLGEAPETPEEEATEPDEAPVLEVPDVMQPAPVPPAVVAAGAYTVMIPTNGRVLVSTAACWRCGKDTHAGGCI